MGTIVRKGGIMAVQGVEGDTKIIWDPENPDEVKNARRTFDDLRGKGFNAYSVKRTGEQGEILRTFDPKAEKIIMAPPMAGG